jgi:hypothetical protein
MCGYTCFLNSVQNSEDQSSESSCGATESALLFLLVTYALVIMFPGFHKQGSA